MIEPPEAQRAKSLIYENWKNQGRSHMIVETLTLVGRLYENAGPYTNDKHPQFAEGWKAALHQVAEWLDERQRSAEMDAAGLLQKFDTEHS